MSKGPINVRVFIVRPLFLAVLLLLAGCGDEAQKAWEKAYHANYEDEYHTKWEVGHARGLKAGEERGATEAREDARKGYSWRLFTTLACGTFGCGAVVGLVIQYVILFTCHFEERLPSPLLLAFVPGMKASLSYSIFERRFRLMVDFDEQLKKILATKNLQVAQTQAIHDAVRQRIMSARSIEELSAARFLELANDEFSRIIAASETTSRSEHGQHADKLHGRYVCTCPHCGKNIAFKEQAANKSVKCPHLGCGHLVKLPPCTLY